MEFIFYCELIGTVIFALQGSIVAIEENLDILGIFILALSTAVGGGMFRDLILGNTPPAMFIHPIYCITAVITVSLIIVTYKYHLTLKTTKSYIYLVHSVTVLDAIGLGIFTVVGANVSIQSGYGENIFLCSFVGVMTGVGGGLLRDILANRTPVILKKEIYAVASIIGAVSYCYLNSVLPKSLAVYISVGIIVMIRLLAVHYNLHLPAINKQKEYCIKTESGALTQK